MSLWTADRQYWQRSVYLMFCDVASANINPIVLIINFAGSFKTLSLNMIKIRWRWSDQMKITFLAINMIHYEELLFWRSLLDSTFFRNTRDTVRHFCNKVKMETGRVLILLILYKMNLALAPQYYVSMSTDLLGDKTATC